MNCQALLNHEGLRDSALRSDELTNADPRRCGENMKACKGLGRDPRAAPVCEGDKNLSTPNSLGAVPEKPPDFYEAGWPGLSHPNSSTSNSLFRSRRSPMDAYYLPPGEFRQIGRSRLFSVSLDVGYRELRARAHTFIQLRPSGTLMFNKALFAIFTMVMVQGVISVPQIGFPVACTGAGDPTCTANGEVCCDLTSVGLGHLCQPVSPLCPA
ncbi:hypothetical protein DFH08DRAFT_825662 [Mycena albidolilacea]|uniref:Uncharacterized protein n=1 Tax=Mycena albidolilacea TaxID=1033008 RepID=A0AAD7E8Z7_9AGAR|nr:hypothetical protein DFH08DRAFT_825662 [Mycena albidolilacea]